jgi:hypothetical protein
MVDPFFMGFMSYNLCYRIQNYISPFLQDQAYLKPA